MTMKLANREVSHDSPLYERVSKWIGGRFRCMLDLHRLLLLVHGPKGCKMGPQLLSTVRHLEAMSYFLYGCTLKEIFVSCRRVHNFVRHVAKVLLVYISNDTLAECLKRNVTEASQDSIYVSQGR